MSKNKVAAAVATFLAMSSTGCVSAPPAEPVPTSPAQGSARTDLREPGGRVVARAVVTQGGDSLRVEVEAAGLAPGAYGAHLHAAGRCDPPTFESAGPHWNPHGREHGRDNPRGQHLGDLPNLLVGADGQGRFEFTLNGAWLASGNGRLLDADGASLVIHARPDDYRTDPSGNSGARLACGVLG